MLKAKEGAMANPTQKEFSTSCQSTQPAIQNNFCNRNRKSEKGKNSNSQTESPLANVSGASKKVVDGSLACTALSALQWAIRVARTSY